MERTQKQSALSALKKLGMSSLLGMIMPVSGMAAVPEGFIPVWSDEFEYSGAPDPTKWGYDLGGGGWGNGESQVYTDSLDNARVENGHLIIEARQVSGSRVPGYTSARLQTREKMSLLYGRVEVRAKVPGTTGTWSAIWMLASDALVSDSFWPDNGEIDIMEHVGYVEDPLWQQIEGDFEPKNIHSTLHTKERNHLGAGGIGGSIRVPDAMTEFHTYAVNWYPDRMEFFVDDVNYHTALREPLLPSRNRPEELWPYWPFYQRFHLILNIAVGGDWGGVFNSSLYPASPYGASGIDHNGVWPQQMVVDYVRVYARPHDPIINNVPGLIQAHRLFNESGVLVQRSQNSQSPYNLRNLDAGDHVTYRLNVRHAGTYRLTAAVATPNPSRQFSVHVAETGYSSGPINVPQTGAWQTWQTIDLGEVPLAGGLNDLRIETATGGFNLAWISLKGAPAGTWKGLEVDNFGFADTQSWMGWVDTRHAPWLYSLALDNYIVPVEGDGETLNTGSQWIYIKKP